MTQSNRMKVLCSAPTTFAKLTIIAYAILPESQTVRAFFTRGHLRALIEDLAGAQDGVGFCVFAASTAVGGVV